MRQILVPLVLTSLLHNAALAQSGAGARPPKACELLTPELVKNVSVKKSADGAPKELELGFTRSACEWGDVTLQIDPFTPAQLETMFKTGGPGWESVSAVGDAAYFHNVKDMMAELYVQVGKRTFGLLMEIPVGNKAATVKPNFITVANAIVPKLR